MERSGFFDAYLVGEEYDRVYIAADFAKYFASFIGNGVFGGKSNELQVVSMLTPDMQVCVSSGQGWIEGRWYENTDDLYLPIEPADGVLNRIDIVVLQLQYAAREMHVVVKKGQPAVNPVAPQLVRNSDFYELQLARINVSQGLINIKQTNIVDTRLDASVCGLVMGVVQQFDTTTFGNQLNTFISDYIEKANKDYEPYLATLDDLKRFANEALQAFYLYLNGLRNDGSTAYQNFVDWLASLRVTSRADVQALLDELQGMLDQDVAALLASRIRELEVQQPTELVAHITDDMGEYRSVDMYEYEYGAGVQACGEGPAGGIALLSTPVEVEMSSHSDMKVRAKSGYGVVDVVSKIREREYAVAFIDSFTSLIIMVR